MADEQRPEEVQRWTAKRRAALVLSLLKGETTAAEAARRHGLTGVTPFRWTVLGCGKKLLDDKFSRSQWAIGSRWPNGGDVGYTTLR